MPLAADVLRPPGDGTTPDLHPGALGGELPGAGAPQEEDDDVLVEALDHDLFEDTYQDDGEMDELYGRAPLQRRRLGRNGPRSDDHGPADGEPGEKTPSHPARNMLARGEILRSQPSPRDPRPLWTKLDDIDLEAIFRLDRRFPVK